MIQQPYLTTRLDFTYCLWSESTLWAENRASEMNKLIVREQIASFGKRVRELRRRRGLSQEELASRADIHPTYLSAVECGKRNPSISILFSIAAGLSVTPAELLAKPNTMLRVWPKGGDRAKKKSR